MKFISINENKSILIRDDGFIEENTTDENGNTIKKVIEPTKEITGEDYSS